MVVGAVLCCFWRPAVWMTLAAMVPMVADGLTQLKTSYESVNLRRFVTGLLFGWALMAFLVVTLGMTYQWGYRTAQRWF